MRYLSDAVDWVSMGYIGDHHWALPLQLYADADFAGDTPSFKSTSGTLRCVHGPKTYLPVVGRTKKQGCVSHYTPEAEVISLDAGMRTLAVPAIGVWEKLLGRAINVTALVDSEATLRIRPHGQERYMEAHFTCARVSIAWLHDLFESSHVAIQYQCTGPPKGDLLANMFSGQPTWDTASRH